MGEENKAKLGIEVEPYVDGQKIKKTSAELVDGVLGSLKDGCVKLPVEIDTKNKKGKTLESVTKEIRGAYKNLYKEIGEMSDKGASLSTKDIDKFIEHVNDFSGKVGKSGAKSVPQIKEVLNILREITAEYRANAAEASRVEKINSAQKTTKTTTRKARNFGTHSKEEIDANTKQHNDRVYRGVEKTGPKGYPSTSIDPGKTNEDLMKLSEYSAHGSKWANELAKTLQIEVSKAAQHLTKWIDPNYEVGSKGGSSRATTERELLMDTIKNVKAQLTSDVKASEKGDTSITLDILKEHAATIKVLTKALGDKTTEDAEKYITGAIQRVYNSSTSTRLGGTNAEPGTQKGVGPNHEETKKLLADLYGAMKQWDADAVADNIAKEMLIGTEKVVDKITKKQKSSTSTSFDNKVAEVKLSSDFKSSMDKLNAATETVHTAVRAGTSATERQLSYDKVENVREAIADSKEQQVETVNRDINRDVARVVKQDAATGFNTDSNVEKLINALENIHATVSEILSTIGNGPKDKLAIPSKTSKTVKETWGDIKHDPSLTAEEKHRIMADTINAAKEGVKQSTIQLSGAGGGSNNKKPPKEEPKSNIPNSSEVEKSKVYATPVIKDTLWDKFTKSLKGATGATDKYNKIISATADDQDQLAAERIKTYGLNNGRNPNDTGDIASIKRALELFRTNKSSIERNSELAQNVKLSKGVEVDTTEVTKAFSKALSGKEMRNAQMGGSIPRQILGAFTGFAGMPSLEKSRAQADGLNQILGNVNKALNSVLDTIQRKETELSGLEKSGDIKFDGEGNVLEGTSASKKTLADLEEAKLVLQSILADMGVVDATLTQTGGKFSNIVKQLSFTSPVLRENNAIIRNINSGLDKGGKALKFQRRSAEILNYTFQLMSRSVGQMFKNLLAQLNPLRLIKRAFQDFASYDPKWQRTMNVVKNNLRRIILPIMEKIAQLLVNMLGVIDIILQKIQAAFGKTPISLFDQQGAQDFQDSIEQTKEDVKSITAGFDELHDIGDDPNDDLANDPNNLMGEIYKPQLSEGWKKFAEKLADLFVNIAKAIKWCIDNWKLLVGLFLAFQLTKGLISLWNWASGMGGLLKGLTLGNLISSIGIAIGAALTLYGIFQDIKLAQDWDQMTPEERTKTANRGDTSMGIGGSMVGAGVGWKLGGSALGAKLGLTTATGMMAGATFGGGIALGISGTANAITGAMNGNYEMVQKESTKAGTGIGMAVGTAVGLKIGTSLGAFAGPVGAAVGAVVGAGLGWAVGKVATFVGDVGGEFSKLKISQEDLTWATDQYNAALGNEYVALQDLIGMEQATGQSGAELYSLVESGTIKYHELTTEQKILLKAYEDYQNCLTTTADALKQQIDYENAILSEKAEESGDYSQFIASMQEATNKGIYTSEEMQDRLSQVYAELSRKEREVFLTQIPEDMRQGVEDGAYQYFSGWQKFTTNIATAHENYKTACSTFWGNVGTIIGNAWNSTQTTLGNAWEGLKTTASNTWENLKTTASTAWEGMKTTAGNIWNSIKIEAGEAWDNIKNSAIGQKVQELAGNVKQKWEELKTNTSQTWENIKQTASEKWENIKNSAIGQKVQETWKNVTTKFNEIKTKLTENWKTLATTASEKWNNIKNSIVDGAKNAWEGAKGFFNKIAEGVKKAWESLKSLAAETGQRIGNFFSGDGWKTDAELTSVASLDVGTNYVPHDGLAYIHEGEAVIPKKYNQPYQPTSLSAEERAYMSQMIQTMTSLDNTMKQGVNVKGQFVQRGSDLVATVEKANNKLSNNILNNKVYAR